MAWIETPARTNPTQPLREAVTLAAAVGFLGGGLARLVLGGAASPTLAALCLPLGAVAAAVVAGCAVNLIALPMLIRILPGHRLPAEVYRTAGVLSALSAFMAAFWLLSVPA